MVFQYEVTKNFFLHACGNIDKLFNVTKQFFNKSDFATVRIEIELKVCQIIDQSCNFQVKVASNPLKKTE